MCLLLSGGSEGDEVNPDPRSGVYDRISIGGGVEASLESAREWKGGGAWHVAWRSSLDLDLYGFVPKQTPSSAPKSSRRRWRL